MPSEWRTERQQRRATRAREQLRAARSAARPRAPRDADDRPDWLSAYLCGGDAAVLKLAADVAAEEQARGDDDDRE